MAVAASGPRRNGLKAVSILNRPLKCLTAPKTTTGAKAQLSRRPQRGAEAPLFHGASNFLTLFRSLLRDSPYRAWVCERHLSTPQLKPNHPVEERVWMIGERALAR